MINDALKPLRIILQKARQKRNELWQQYRQIDVREWMMLQEKEQLEELQKTENALEGDAITLMTRHHFIETQGEKIRSIEMTLSTLNEERIRLQKDVNKAHIEVKKFEKLLQKQITALQKAAEKAEQKSIEETATTFTLHQKIVKQNAKAS